VHFITNSSTYYAHQFRRGRNKDSIAKLARVVDEILSEEIKDEAQRSFINDQYGAMNPEPSPPFLFRR
jgi:methyl coenzyme M reductase subunit C-like uncharacterized protein (methanogenesis marker protein 7)